jgi:3-hydroxyphenylacetate 6-hydroxylase
MISILLPLLSDQLLEHTLRSILTIVIGIPITYIVINEFVRRSLRLKDFDGPTNWPLVGNIPDIKYNAAEKYREWSKIFGDVYQIQLGNVPVIVVNSAESARKIFGQNSQALSSRPVFWTFHKVCQTRQDADLGESWLTRIGAVEYCRNDDRHFAIQRLFEEEA